MRPEAGERRIPARGLVGRVLGRCPRSARRLAAGIAAGERLARGPALGELAIERV